MSQIDSSLEAKPGCEETKQDIEACKSEKSADTPPGKLGSRLKAFENNNDGKDEKGNDPAPIVPEKSTVSKAKSIFQQNLENAKNMEAALAKAPPPVRSAPGKLSDKARAFEQASTADDSKSEIKPAPRVQGKLTGKASMFEALAAQKLADMNAHNTKPVEQEAPKELLNAHSPTIDEPVVESRSVEAKIEEKPQSYIEKTESLNEKAPEEDSQTQKDEIVSHQKQSSEDLSKPAPGKLTNKAKMFEALVARQVTEKEAPKAEEPQSQAPKLTTPITETQQPVVEDVKTAAPEPTKEPEIPIKRRSMSLLDKARAFDKGPAMENQEQEPKRPPPGSLKSKVLTIGAALSGMQNPAPEADKAGVPEKESQEQEPKRPPPGSLKSKVLTIGAALSGMQNPAPETDKAAPPPKKTNAMLDRISMLSGTLGKGPMPMGTRPPKNEEEAQGEAPSTLSYTHDEYYTEEIEMKEMTEILGLDDPLSSVFSGVNTIPLLTNYDLYLIPDGLIKSYVRPAALDDPDYVYVQSNSIVRNARPSRGRRPPTRK